MSDDAGRATPPSPVTSQDRDGGAFVIRGFRPAFDHDGLLSMYRRFEPKRAAQGLPPEGEQGIRRWLDHVLPQGWHFVVEIGGAIMGHLMMIPMAGGDIELANFLDRTVRNRGIGTELNRFGLAVAARHGFRRVWLCVEPRNRAAIRSYEKAGFRTIERTMFQPELEMEAFTTTNGQPPPASDRD